MARPAKYNSPKDMENAIDAYFKRCEGVPLLDKEGNTVVTKFGIAYQTPPKPPTITGLALAIGFNSRQSLLNYCEKTNARGEKLFLDTITRAKSVVEEYTETRLFDKDGANGAKFSLTNNFKGWVEKQELSGGETPLEIKIKVID